MSLFLLFIFCCEADRAALLLGWGHELTDRFDDRTNMYVVFTDLAFKFSELLSKVLVGGEHLAQANECPNNLDAGLDSNRTVKARSLTSRRHVL